MTALDWLLFALTVSGLWARCIVYHRDTEAMARQGLITAQE